MAFIDEFVDMMPDTLVAQPGYPDEYGNFVPSGALLSPSCRIEGQVRLVRSTSGKEVVSSVQCIVDGAYGLTTDRHRYTLPVRFAPRTALEAVGIERVSDESGPSYEVVLLP